MSVTAVKQTPNGSKILSNGNVLTPEGRFTFLSLFHKTKSPKYPEQREKYSASLLFKKDEDLSILKQAWIDVMTKKFGASKEEWPKKEMMNPFRKQGEWYKADGKTLHEGCVDGAFYIVCRSDQKPGVVNAQNQYIEEDKIWSGCYGRLTIRAFWPKSNNGVFFGLQNAQLTRTGEPFGSSRAVAEDEFDAVEGDVMGETATAGKAGNADPLADMMN
jgi:hypothetical protein